MAPAPVVARRRCDHVLDIRQLIPLLLLRKFLPDVVFREAEFGDGYPGVLFRLRLQILRSVRE
jgi:hypothetical protein